MREVEYDYETPVDSSAIKRVVYSNKNKELFIVFPGGNMAGYKDVQPDDVYDLVQADSVGSYYARNIRGNFRGINTDGVSFVKAKPATTTANVSSVGSVSSGQIFTVPKNKFRVTFATVVTIDVDADTIAQAIVKVEQGNPNAVVTEVKKV